MFATETLNLITMTAAEMLSYFNLEQDKASEPLFTDAEIYTFLNAAQMDFVNSFLMPNDANAPQIKEVDERAVKVIDNLIFRATAVADAAGIITYSNIKSDASVTEDIIAIMEVSDAVSSVAATYTRPSDWVRRNANQFTAGSTANGIANYTYDATQIRVSPSTRTWNITFVKSPKDISAVQDCELSESTHYKIVAMALEKAGIATEAEMLPAINQITE